MSREAVRAVRFRKNLFLVHKLFSKAKGALLPFANVLAPERGAVQRR